MGISRNCGTLELGRCQGTNFNSAPKRPSNTGLNTMTEKEQVFTALSELKKMVTYEEIRVHYAGWVLGPRGLLSSCMRGLTKTEVHYGEWVLGP
jgi:hypothetical protein